MTSCKFEIDPEFHQLCPPLTDEEFEKLEANIIADGCRDALVVWREGGLLLDGHNRYNICTANSIAYEVAELSLPDREAATNWIIDNQLGRRNVTPQQASYLRGKRYNREKAEHSPGRPKKEDQNDPLFGESTADRLAEQYGVSAPTIKRDAQFASAVDAFEPDTRSEILSGQSDYTKQEVIEARGEKDILDKAKEIRKRKAESRRQERVEEAKSIKRLPDKTYNVVYADPPWEYSNTGVHGAANHHYETMSTEELFALPESIDLRVANNAVLFLWITNPLMAEAFSIIERWGFTYKTNMVWIKTDLKKPGSGFYVRGRHELLFVCTRGSFTPLDQNISPPIGSVIESPVREHSRKPEAFYEIIERLYPECSYIELFARSRREGWDAWGDQTDSNEPS